MVRKTLGEKHGYASLEKGAVVSAIYDKPVKHLILINMIDGRMENCIR